MKHKKSDNDSHFVEYDDENLEHVLAGPDYGQINSGSKETAWIELESKEFPQLVSDISRKIIKHPLLKIA